MKNREETIKILEQYIKNPSLRNHSFMVASAMEAYARSFGFTEDVIEEWWSAGILHDIDWEQFPEEHPNKAVKELLVNLGYSNNIIEAIKAHAPERTGKLPTELIEKYLFACDEISGFINAVSLVRPTKFQGMDANSIIKRLKDLRFASNVSREDIEEGLKLIERDKKEHFNFLIEVFKKM